jgi:DNA-binding CsgD family transcriptional regulator
LRRGDWNHPARDTSRCTLNLNAALQEFLQPAQNNGSARDRLSLVSNQLDYDFVIAQYIPASRSKLTRCIDNHPEQWRHAESSIPDEVARHDPVLTHLSTQVNALVWDQRTYVDAGLGQLYESFSGHGLGSGLSLATRAPNGDRIYLGFSNNDRTASDTSPIMQIAVAHVVAAAAFEFFVDDPKVIPERKSGLSLREIDCLQWSHAGKTSWETSVILGLSEHTVVHYLKRAIKKLGAANKVHAVAIALSRGLVG